MKLTDPQIAQIKDQVGVEPVPAEGPAAKTLAAHFGEHTFYVTEEGLHFFEAAETLVKNGPCDVHPVKVAAWTNEKREALAPHDPVVGPAKATIDVEE